MELPVNVLEIIYMKTLYSLYIFDVFTAGYQKYENEDDQSINKS